MPINRKAKVAAAQRRYYERNRERLLAKNRAYAQTPHGKAVRKRCQRASYIRIKYGMELHEYEALLARGCAICESTKNVVVDHCHASGKVRDALCQSCNVALGMLDDDPDRLRRAADYIEQHRRAEPSR